MKNNAVSFAVLQRVLEDLGFVRKKVGGPQMVLEHGPSDTVFLFRAYKARDKVAAADLIGVRKILDEKGVIEPQALEEMLHQPSV
jgi:hypothetical protein